MLAGSTPRGSVSILSAILVLSLLLVLDSGLLVVVVVCSLSSAGLAFGVSSILRLGESRTMGVFSTIAATALLRGSESTFLSADLGEGRSS